MNVYIVIDMECIAGVVSEYMVRVGSPEWANRTRYLMTAEVNAAIEGAVAGGAKRIWVQDGHDVGLNLISEKLHPRAELVAGAGMKSGQMPALDSSFDMLFLMGFHARMGTGKALMDHSVTTTTISEIRLNGLPVGEIGIYAAYAGFLGVPVTLVTGDVAGVSEAKELLGNEIETVEVMEGYGRFVVRVPSYEEIHPRIRAAAERAVARKGSLWKPDTPLHVAIDFLRSAEADMAEMVPGAQRVGPRTLEYQHDDPAMSFKALEAMINLGSIAANRWARIIYTTGER